MFTPPRCRLRLIMPEHSPRHTLCRHGQTAWTISRQHTGLSDVPLTEIGREEARQLGARLRGRVFDAVWSSPSSRARETCEIAGFTHRAIVRADLAEWHYGAYEGKTSAEIRLDHAGWDVFKDGAPGGESAADVVRRADGVVADLRASGGNVLIFSSGHFLRALAARWLGLPITAGRLFVLGTASLSEIGYEHGDEDPALLLWNERDDLTR